MLGKSIKITLGIVAGAALASFAVSKKGQDTLKKIGERTAALAKSLQKDLLKAREENNYFI